jgi:hypothetical protein
MKVGRLVRARLSEEGESVFFLPVGCDGLILGFLKIDKSH